MSVRGIGFDVSPEIASRAETALRSSVAPCWAAAAGGVVAPLAVFASCLFLAPETAERFENIALVACPAAFALPIGSLWIHERAARRADAPGGHRDLQLGSQDGALDASQALTRLGGSQVSKVAVNWDVVALRYSQGGGVPVAAEAPTDHGGPAALAERLRAWRQVAAP